MGPSPAGLGRQDPHFDLLRYLPNFTVQVKFEPGWTSRKKEVKANSPASLRSESEPLASPFLFVLLLHCTPTPFRPFVITDDLYSADIVIYTDQFHPSPPTYTCLNLG
jgi:hypothetical protein